MPQKSMAAENPLFGNYPVDESPPLRQLPPPMRDKVTLQCTEAKNEGKPVSRYITTRNKKNTPERLELKKYNPFLRRHTLHREIK